MPKKAPRKRVKAGTSKAAAAQRRKLFAHHYVANGRNATQAAIAAGFSQKTAYEAAHRLLKDVRVSKQIDHLCAEVVDIVGSDMERTIKENSRILELDPARLHGPDGKLLPIGDLHPDVRAAIASIEYDTETGAVKRLRFFDKGGAIDRSIRTHGGYERDNRQRMPNLALQINIVGSDGEVVESELRKPGD